MDEKNYKIPKKTNRINFMYKKIEIWRSVARILCDYPGSSVKEIHFYLKDHEMYIRAETSVRYHLSMMLCKGILKVKKEYKDISNKQIRRKVYYLSGSNFI